MPLIVFGYLDCVLVPVIDDLWHFFVIVSEAKIKTI